MDFRLSLCRISVTYQSYLYLLAIFVLQNCESYNLEGRLPLFKYGPRGSTFGFSVAQHRTSTDDLSGLQNTLLVVGAPTANALPSQPGSNKPGGMFYCPISTDPDECTRVIMDSGGDSRGNGIKSDQWLGVSVKSQGPGKMLISCAHRWREHFNSQENELERVCGKCFLLNATTSDRIDEVAPDDLSLSSSFISSPCSKMPVKNQNSKSEYAYCQAGASIDITNNEYILASPCDSLDRKVINSKNTYGYMQAGTSIHLHNDQYLLGAPGTWAWSGAMFDINMPKDTPAGIDSRINALLGQGEATMYSTPTCFINERSNDPTTLKCDKIPVRRDSYMGFSVSSSNAIAVDSDETFYFAGAPRANNTGAVIIFTKGTGTDGVTRLNYVPVQSVLGESTASSFGFSIALTDLNGDGLDDLIVGAPQYYLYSNEGKRGGAVYVYINKPNRGFRQVGAQRFYGPLDSFFGHSVVALGDIDQDGFNDFAVGSPYEGENGVVHIYRGSPSGKIKQSQVLEGKDYPHVRESGKGEIKGFGSSLSGNIDADSNKYPDLLIGTNSDHAVLFRTRPVIKLSTSLDVRPKQLDLRKENCSFAGEDYSCFGVRYCFTYESRHKEYTEDVKIEYTLILDSVRIKNKRSSRVHFDSASGPSVVKEKLVLPAAGRKVCPGRFHNIYFNKNVEDKLSNIGIGLEFNLDSKEVKRENIGDDVYAMIDDPILDADLPAERTQFVSIKNNCGSDGCQSNLAASADMPKEIVIGDDTTLTLNVNVSNDAEEAHQSFVIITIPSNVVFDSFTVTDPSGADVQCYSASSGLSSFIRCDLGNPYLSDSEDTISIQLDVSRLTADDKTIEVQVSAHTTSENPEIPQILLRSLVIIEMDLSLTVQSQPEQVRYTDRDIVGESAMVYTQDVGPVVVYTFNVKNEASQPASGVNLNVELPYEIKNGKWLLYLVTSDVTSGSSQATGSCGSSNVNILQLRHNPSSISPSALRSKRSAQESSAFKTVAQASSSGGSYQSVMFLTCDRNTAHCINIVCQLDEIMPGTTTSIIIQAHVWEASFLEEFRNIDLVYVETKANISTSQENVRFKGDKLSDTIRTTVDHDFFRGDVGSTFPWWYILIGVIILLIIYVLIIFFLIKCGFFKRKKYHKHDDEDDGVHELHPDEKKEREMDESNM